MVEDNSYKKFCPYCKQELIGQAEPGDVWIGHAPEKAVCIITKNRHRMWDTGAINETLDSAYDPMVDGVGGWKLLYRDGEVK